MILIAACVVWGFLLSVIYVAAHLNILFYAASGMCGLVLAMLGLLTITAIQGPKPGPAGLTFVSSHVARGRPNG